MIHFLYRFTIICCCWDATTTSHAGLGKNLGVDLLSMVLLALPNITSYLLPVNTMKKGNDGFSIWKEYSGHDFVFSLKLWLLLGLFVYAEHFQDGYLQYDFMYRIVAEFGTMYGLQAVTQQYPPQRVSTIRGMYEKSPSGIFLAGFMQFLGRASVFYGTPDPQDMIPVCVLGLMVVQLNAFHITLRKKRIIGPKSTQLLYTFLLSSGFYLIVARRLWERPPRGILDARFKMIYLALIAYSCRRYGMDRYSSWFIALSIMGLLDQLFGLFESVL